MRGYWRRGEAAIPRTSTANFFVNEGNAAAADVAALKALAQQRIRDQFGVEMENEVSLVGEGFGND